MSDAETSSAQKDSPSNWVKFNEQDPEEMKNIPNSNAAIQEKHDFEVEPSQIVLDTSNEVSSMPTDDLTAAPSLNTVTSDSKSKTTNWVQFEDDGKLSGASPLEADIQVHVPAIVKNVENEQKPDLPTISSSVNEDIVKPTLNHPLSDGNNENVGNDHSVAVDVSVTCVQHTTPGPRNFQNDVMKSYQVRNNNSRTVNQGFNNGDVIVTVLPLNNNCTWLSKARFKPELVPEELMAQGLTLTVEDYVQAMRILVNDFRYNMYIICYKRILITWILIGFIFLLSFLFSGIRGIKLFACGIIWLILNALGIFFCMWFKMKLKKGLEYCIAEVNSLFYKQKILLALDDRGKLSCHKVNLIFIYFDVTDCVKYLHNMLELEDRGVTPSVASEGKPREVDRMDLDRMDIDESDIVISGSTNTVLSQRQKRAERLLLRYSQRWAKEFVRRRLDLNIDLYTERFDQQPLPPRHCQGSRCPCQYIEEYLCYKPSVLAKLTNMI